MRRGVSDSSADSHGELELITDGDSLYERILADFAQARCDIGLASYIWTEDVIGARFADALLTRHRAGVRVRVAADSFGSLRWPRHRAPARLAAAGVPVTARGRPEWRTRIALRRRDHRKLMGCDASTSYLVGFNLYRQSSRRFYGRSHWHDTHVRVASRLAADCADPFERLLIGATAPEVVHASVVSVWIPARPH
jgi:cardiolipin synthase